jgi:hypothetical protein
VLLTFKLETRLYVCHYLIGRRLNKTRAMRSQLGFHDHCSCTSTAPTPQKKAMPLEYLITRDHANHLGHNKAALVRKGKGPEKSKQ